MKTSLKALVAAVAFCVTGGAQAAINTDNVNGGGGLTTGTGVGELFFTVYDSNRSQSLIFDLNLTVNDFRNNNAALINTFSASDTTLQSFIAGGNQADMVWNIGGISNKGFGPDIGIVTTHGNAGVTIDASEAPINGSAVTTAMNNADFYASQNNSFIDAGATGNSNVSSSTATTGYLFGTWGDGFGGALFFSNIAALDDLMLMSFIHLDESDPMDAAPLVQAFADGFWKLDAAAGSVSYVSAVPLPPALWLLGASLVGLVGVARRRKDESESMDNAVVA